MKQYITAFFLFVLTLFSLTIPAAHASYQTGTASWYGPGFHGRLMANGQRFNQMAPVVAHRTLPFGTKVKVTNTRTGRSAIATVTDRGPFVGNRVIDVSKGIAMQIGMLHSGTAPVQIKVLHKPAKSITYHGSVKPKIVTKKKFKQRKNFVAKKHKQVKKHTYVTYAKKPK